MQIWGVYFCNEQRHWNPGGCELIEFIILFMAPYLCLSVHCFCNYCNTYLLWTFHSHKTHISCIDIFHFLRQLRFLTISGNLLWSTTKCYMNATFKSSVFIYPLSCKLDFQLIPSGTLRRTLAMLLRQSCCTLVVCVCLCVHTYLLRPCPQANTQECSS